MNGDPSDGNYSSTGNIVLRGTVLILSILGTLILAVYLIVSTLEKQHSAVETRGDLTDRFQEEKTITYQGAQYRHRSKLTKILLMGIDQNTDTVSTGFRNGGQADFLLLLVFDAQAKTVTPIQIDRDTMTPITVLGVLGNPAGTRIAQISLSHGFGDGKEQSCQFTVDAATRLMLGETIDYYISMQLDGISVLNDWVGGVTVTLADDFSALDPRMLPGVTLTLQGDQAEYFVRSRMNVGIGTNEARMVRQQLYLKGLGDLLDAKIHSDANCVGDLFDVLKPYLVTNMKRGRMINQAWVTRQFERIPIAELPGVHTVGSDGFMEYTANPDQLTEAMIQQFYEPVEASETDLVEP